MILPSVFAPARRRRCHLAALAAALLLGACGSQGAADPVDRPDATIGGVGSLPSGRLTRSGVGTLPSGALVPVPQQPVGDRAAGNRLVLIGDSILAGTSTRYGGQACSTLVPLGWRVAVEAEVARAIDFGNRVLDRRGPDEWDAAVVFLGTNYGGDEVRYEAELDRILDRLAPRPVVLVTVTNHSPLQAEVNAIIEGELLARANVDVFDWTTLSTTPGALIADGIHPTDTGRRLLLTGLAELLGDAPEVEGAPASCLPSQLVDDSAGKGIVPMPQTTPTTRPTSSGVATTSPPPPTTVVTTSTVPTTGVGTTTAPSSSSVPLSAPPTTSAVPSTAAADETP
jgi:hypothetical protein